MIKRFKQSFLVLLTLFMVGVPHLSYGQTSAQQEPDLYVFVRLLADKTQVTGGDTVRIGMEQIIHKKYPVINFEF